MPSGFGRFGRRVGALAQAGVCELRQVFGAWLKLPDAFGAPARRRLFFPLTHVLAVLVTDACG